MCALIWALSLTSSGAGQASARGEACAIILIVVLFAASGAAILKAIRGKS